MRKNNAIFNNKSQIPQVSILEDLREITSLCSDEDSPALNPEFHHLLVGLSLQELLPPARWLQRAQVLFNALRKRETTTKTTTTKCFLLVPPNKAKNISLKIKRGQQGNPEGKRNPKKQSGLQNTEFCPFCRQLKPGPDLVHGRRAQHCRVWLGSLLHSFQPVSQLAVQRQPPRHLDTYVIKTQRAKVPLCSSPGALSTVGLNLSCILELLGELKKITDACIPPPRDSEVIGLGCSIGIFF